MLFFSPILINHVAHVFGLICVCSSGHVELYFDKSKLFRWVFSSLESFGDDSIVEEMFLESDSTTFKPV